MSAFFASFLAAGLFSFISAVTLASTFSPWTFYDKSSGLIDNTVQVITRDPAGGFWIGTAGGLSHYDGERWINFTTADGLPDKNITGIFVDPVEGLWLAAERGFGLFRDGHWSRLGLPGDAGDGRVAVVVDGQGTTWFGYEGGLIKYDVETRELITVPEMEGVSVRNLVIDEDGRLWIGAVGEVRNFDGTFWETFSDRNGLPSARGTAMLADSRGHIWYGTENGLGEYDGIGWQSFDLADDLPNSHITALAEDREGMIWVGTLGGAGYYDGYEWVWLTSRSGLPANEVLALSSDENGSIWIGTPRGLSKYDTSWIAYTGSGETKTSPRGPLLSGADGSIYLAADNGFLVKERLVEDYYSLDSDHTVKVTAFLETSYGDAWIGTDWGLFFFSRGDLEHFMPPELETEYVERYWGAVESVKRRNFSAHEGLKGKMITALCLDDDERLWVGTSKGLSRYDKIWEIFEENEVLYDAEIKGLALDGEGKLWVATSSRIWIYADKNWVEHQQFPAFNDNRINSLAVDEEGKLWALTDRGAARWDGQIWNFTTMAEGLISDQVLTLFKDSAGNMWFGTRAGVSKYNGKHWSSFGENEGLHYNGIDSIIEKDGHLWFGSSRGVSVYRPDRAPPNTRIKNAPQVTVGASSYLFEFAGSDLETQAHNLKYSHRLDDGDWSDFSFETRVTLSDLTNGTHTFQVRAMDHNLNVDSTPATAVFEVNTALFDLDLVEAEFEGLYASLYQFYASDPDWESRPVGRILIKSKYDKPLRVKASIFISQFMDFPTDHVVTIPPGEKKTVPLRIELNDKVLNLEETTTRQVRLTLQYSLKGELKEYESSHPVTLFEKHSMTWEDPQRIGLYVTHLDRTVESFARNVVRQFKEMEKETILYEHLMRAIEIFDALGALGVRYIADPDNPYPGLSSSRKTLDLIRLPRETLKSRAGDCDDVSVLYASLLENIGIDTAIVDVFDHVYVMFDTGLREKQYRQLVQDKNMLFIDEEKRIWIPVEVTLLGQPFSKAWKSGAKTIHKRQPVIYELAKAWEQYSPINPPGQPITIGVPTREEIWPLFREDLRLQEETLISTELRLFQERLERDPDDVEALNSLGIILAKNGFLGQAAANFQRVIALAPQYHGGYSNLANVLYERESYGEALEHYKKALMLAPDSPEIHVEIALTYCETGEFDKARFHYREAMKLNPDLE